ADAVAVDRGGGQRGDRVLVQVGGDQDAGVEGAERVELLPDLLGGGGQVAGVDADRAQLVAGQVDRGVHGLGHVVGVDEEGGVEAERGDLGLERLPFGVVQERERVRGRAGRGDAVQPPGLQVGGGGEPGEV